MSEYKVRGNDKMKELKGTIELMISEDYKDRFRAEYQQTKIRYETLHRKLVKYAAGTLTFNPVVDIYLLRHQAAIMRKYLYLLEERAKIESIKLDGKSGGYRQAEKEKRKGYWFDAGSLSCRCSECGCKNNKESNYCPECGAYMRGDKNENISY